MRFAAEMIQAIRDPDNARRHAGPPLIVPAVAFTLLSAFSWHLEKHGLAPRWGAFLLFGSALPLGIFTAVVVSQLRWLGTRVAGTHIALFGGFLAAFNLAASGLFLGVKELPGVASSPAGMRALEYFMFAFSGVGFSVPVALLCLGISIPCLVANVLPRWVSVVGIGIAILGLLSWLALLMPGFLFFVPAVRIGVFLWMIAVGLLLPSRKA